MCFIGPACFIDSVNGGHGITLPANVNNVREIICVGDKLVWMSTSGMLYVRQASPDKGGPIAGMNVFGACPKDTKKDLAGYNGKVTSSPTFANGRLYCRAPWGEVVCLDVKP